MLHNVRQRLLDDAVDRKLEGRRERPAGAAGAQLNRGSGRPDRLGELFQVGEPRCRSEGGGLWLPVAQQPEHHPQFVLGGSPDHFDRLQRPLDLLRTLRQEPPADAGLDGHHPERVRDDVMQVPGDPYPFLADLLVRPLKLGRALALLLPGQPREIPPPGDNADADKPRGDQRDGSVERLSSNHPSARRERRIQETATERHERRDSGASRGSPAKANGDEVHREAKHAAERQRNGPERILHAARERSDREERQRPAPQQDDRKAGENRYGQAEGRATRDLVRLRRSQHEGHHRAAPLTPPAAIHSRSPSADGTERRNSSIVRSVTPDHLMTVPGRGPPAHRP